MERNESSSISSRALAVGGLLVSSVTSAAAQQWDSALREQVNAAVPGGLDSTNEREQESSLLPAFLPGIAGTILLVGISIAAKICCDRYESLTQANTVPETQLPVAQVAESPAVEPTSQQRAPGFEAIWEAEGRQEPTFVVVEQPGNTPYSIGVNFSNRPNEAVQSNADVPARQSSFSGRLSEDRESNTDRGLS